MTALVTHRLHGRPCTAGDSGHIAALLGDHAVRRWVLPAGREWSAARAGALARALDAHWQAHGWGPRLWFADGALVGLAGLRFAVIGGEGAVEVTLAVAADRQGRGFGRELMGAVMAEAPQISSRVRAAVLEGNRRSAALLTSLGFRPVGRLCEAGQPCAVLEWVAR
ncbi:MAG: hypothetical protein KatS3mg118_1360 [Paracoccaceae bacterium]|nr:MAG: hypothetical protein KatS3mg118_1360 [Paracoccaceae bacterium]